MRASGSSKASTRCRTKRQAHQGKRWCSKMLLHHTDSKPYFSFRHGEADTRNCFCSRSASSNRQGSEPPGAGPDSCIHFRLSNEDVNAKTIHRSDLDPRFDLMGQRFRYYLSATKWLQVHSSSSYLLIWKQPKKLHNQEERFRCSFFPKPTRFSEGTLFAFSHRYRWTVSKMQSNPRTHFDNTFRSFWVETLRWISHLGYFTHSIVILFFQHSKVLKNASSHQ